MRLGGLPETEVRTRHSWMSLVGQEGLLNTRSRRLARFSQEILIVILTALALVFMTESKAAVQPLLMGSLDSSVPIYRHLSSQFSSGRLARFKLEGTIGRTVTEPWFEIKSASRSGWISSEAILTELDLASFVVTQAITPMRATRFQTEPAFRQLSRGKLIRALAAREGSILVSIQGEGKVSETGWVESKFLAPYPSSWGRAYFPHVTNLFSGPSKGSQRKGRVRAATYARIKSAKGQYLEVETAESQRGFVLAKEVITRLSFADEVYAQGRWQAIGGRFPLESVKGFRSQKRWGFTIEKAPYLDMPNRDGKALAMSQVGERLPIEREHRLIWAESKAQSHGLVWWPLNDAESHSTSLRVVGRLTFKDLKRRGIFTLVREPKPGGIQFASARGLYKSSDGLVWEEIPSFSEQNYPLAFDSQGALLAGPYRSRDKGLTFEPYFRAEELLTALQGSRNSFRPRQIPKSLRITAIKTFRETGEIRLKLELTPASSYWVSTRDVGRTWHLR